jgi:hypothetical protein
VGTRFSSREEKSKTSASPKPVMTHEEVVKLARELVTNQVFMSDRIINPERMLHLVFMPLAFLKKKDIALFKKEGVAHFYEYNRLATPRSINGLPMFMSCHRINSTDYARVIEKEREMRTALEEITNAKETTGALDPRTQGDAPGADPLHNSRTTGGSGELHPTLEQKGRPVGKPGRAKRRSSRA